MALPSAEAAPSARAAQARAAWPHGVAVVGYDSARALRAALERHPARIVRRIPALHVVEVKPRDDLAGFVAALSRHPGIRYVERLASRARSVEPAVVPTPYAPGGAYEWQYAATREDAVDPAVLRAASAITIAVVDTGADLSAPDLAAKSPGAYSVVSRSGDVTDLNGHGTFVASLAAGSVTNGDGIVGFGGDASLLVVQAGRGGGSFTDVAEASAIVYAVDHGAKIINLSLGGKETSRTERSAIDYAVSHGVLLVAAVGNSFLDGNPVEYPAALLQPVGSQGLGGTGLAVGATTISGSRAEFSNTGSHVSLAAPGEDVFGAISSTSPEYASARVLLPGSVNGYYGFASGTSFSAPEVAGAAALVWAANPSLTASGVASILKSTASGHGVWTPELGFGGIDVAAAVAAAQGQAAGGPRVQLIGERTGRRVRLTWSGQGAASYRLTVRADQEPGRVLIPSTATTSASYEVTPGHVYSFTVEAINETGSPIASSEPYSVALVQARSALSLTAARRSGGHPLRAGLAASLRSSRPDVSVSGRSILLEAFDGRAWRLVARGVTSTSGRAAWSVSLDASAYRLRARFAGSDDLAAATSAPVILRVR